MSARPALAACLFLLSPLYGQVSLEARLRLIEAVPNNPTTLYALPTLGLLRSTDAGLNWVQVPVLPRTSQPPALNSLALSPQSASTFFVCGQPAGNAMLWRTVDGGLNFRALTNGLPDLTGRTCEHIDAFGTSLYVQISGGVNNSWEIFKSTNNGDSWTRLGSAPRRVFIAPSAPTTMLYGAGNQVFRSTNEGQSFVSFGQVYTATGSLDGVNTLAIQPTNPNIVIATVGGPGANVGLYRSTNGGAMWERSFSGSTIGVRFNRYNPAEVWAGDCCGNLSLRRSSNSGESWVELRIRLDETPITPTSGPMIFSLPNSPNTLIAGTSSGFYRSDNGGAAFARRGFYTPWAAGNLPALGGRLLTREATTARPSLRIQGAEDESYRFPEILPGTASVPWVTQATVAGSTYTPSLTARTLEPGEHRGVVTIAVPGAPNSPIEVPVQLTVTSEVRNSYLYGGPLDGVAGFTSMAASSSGTVLFASSSRIFELSPQGALRAVAGGGSLSGANGNGVSALQANLSLVTSPIYSPQGEIVFAERSAGLIRRISRDGILSTMAGGGTGSPAAGLSPEAIRFNSPQFLAYDATGNLIVADSNRLWRIANNQLELLAGGGTAIDSGTLGSAFAFNNPRGLAVHPDGRIFFTISSRHAVFVLENNRVLQFAGSATVSGDTGNGGSAFLARFRNPTFLTTSAAGDVYVVDNTNLLIRRIRPDGRIDAVMGTEVAGSAARCAVAESAPLGVVSALLVRGNTLLYADSGSIQQIFLLQGDTQTSAARPIAAANGASFTNQVSPGAIFTLFGDRLAPGESFARSVPLPSVLGNSAICLDGYPVPLFYTSTNQVNGQVPYEVRTGEAAYLRVFTPAGVSPPLAVTFARIAPGIFQLFDRQAIAVNPDGRLNSPTTPVAPGQAVVVYLTGTGQLDNPVPTNTLAPGNPLSRPTGPVSATLNGVATPVLFLGLTPGFIGLGQANLSIPNLPPGTYDLIITIDGISSAPARLTVG